MAPVFEGLSPMFDILVFKAIAPPNSLHLSLNTLSVIYSFHFPSPSDSQKMADLDQQNRSPEIKERSPKIWKLNHNGAANVTQQFPLLRVKKLSENAILPSRASRFSAGYDLSSAIEIKVPARGKAWVATGLSIGIREGTYARVGKSLSILRRHIMLFIS
ncbi:hypothetical protein Nepgr_024710 [Nepenthes gracilis]|uniref:dUTP diphosphatase n=1 Tax=Nepenthes gracilis TaxID=150966 RepID=A0AAD3T519_NEPGR|nr:hypothetical protein Nepgr_024710 [Nepenthes gracilis]